MQLGKYRLVRLIGQGGMGEVWEGALEGEGGFARRVAIKRLKAQGGETWERRFLDEARIASRLHHANIVSVLDFGAAEGEFFQVLELIDGIDARRLYELSVERGQKLPVELALHLCVEVAHALASAHAAKGEDGRALQIVHRDVSLENVLVSWQGDVKLSDFGVAKARDRSHETMAGSTVGKPSYMAPEQATGGDVDGRTDVFALGCVLHALLVGVTPLAHEDRMAELLSGKPLPIDASVPEDVAQLIAKAIQRSKAERFGSADEMGEALAKLRHARISEDPRRLLSAFLERLRPKPKATGSLDALLGVGLATVEGVAAKPEATKKYGGGADAAPFPALAGAPQVGTMQFGGSSVPAAAAPAALAPVSPKRSAVPLVAGVAVLALLAAGAVALVYQPSPLGEGVRSTGEGAAALPDGPSTPPIEPKFALVQPSLPDASVAAPEQPKSKSHPPRPAGPAEQGVLKVAGELALRGEILVDGRSMGFAPKQLELAVGHHELWIVQPDGKRIGPHQVEITARNTENDPMIWIVR